MTDIDRLSEIEARVAAVEAIAPLPWRWNSYSGIFAGEQPVYWVDPDIDGAHGDELPESRYPLAEFAENALADLCYLIEQLKTARTELAKAKPATSFVEEMSRRRSLPTCDDDCPFLDAGRHCIVACSEVIEAMQAWQERGTKG